MWSTGGIVSNLFFRQRFLNYVGSRSWISTIYALSSGQGKCGVAVIRVSGPQAATAALKIACLQSLPHPRQAILRKFKDPVEHDILDKGILIWFPGPKSFTGEDSCEFQVHGGPAVVSAMLRALGKLEGFRPADAGEFTRRAFHAGKMDLTEVEGLADLIDAETDAQRKQALLQAEGSLSSLYNNWRQIIIKSIGYVEAFIDFSEDENIEDDVLDRVETMVHHLMVDIQKHLEAGRCGERLRSGVRTTIIGEPNVGKSSLLNILCDRPAAIVSPIPGTTRDVLELYLSIGGYPIVIADTAGLRCNPSDSIEKEGMTRAVTQLLQSDLVLVVVDASQYPGWVTTKDHHSFSSFLQDYVLRMELEGILMDVSVSSESPLTDDLNLSYVTLSVGCRGLDSSVEKSLCECPSDEKFSCSQMRRNEHIEMSEKQCLIIFNKIDLLQETHLKSTCSQYSNVIPISCKTEDGILELVNKSTQKLAILCGNPVRECPTFSQARHRHHVAACATCLTSYLEIYKDDIVFAAQQLRKAVRHIASITGHVSTEHILDVIFKDFCIGK